MEQTERILDLIEHPERYSETEITEMLADEEARKLYQTLCETNEAMLFEATPQADIDAQWQRFDEALARHTQARRNHQLRKIAASVAAVVMVSGLTWAAIHIVRPHRGQTDTPQAMAQTAAAVKPQPADTLPTKPQATHRQPKTFVNVTLERMLSEMAAHYQAKVEFKRPEARQLRLYYEWDPAQSLRQVADDLNGFNQVGITLHDNTLIIE